MTRTDLYALAIDAYKRNWHHDGERLNRCKAWVYRDKYLQVVILVSRSSVAAVYWRGIVWKFNRTSSTTTKHIFKFARLLEAPVVPLYGHSRMAISDYNVCVASDWEDFISDVLKT